VIVRIAASEGLPDGWRVSIRFRTLQSARVIQRRNDGSGHFDGMVDGSLSIMLMVVLGAGASYDCAPGHDILTPPLAKDLFAPRRDFLAALARIPAATSIVGRMRSAGRVGGGIEGALGQFMELARRTDDVYYKRDVLALRFYLRDIIQQATASAVTATSGLTSQLRLVTRLHDLQVEFSKKVIFVSFNYDALLEMAITARFGYRFDSMESYVNAPMPVFKPHGSVNWVERIPRSYPYPPADVMRYMDLSQIDKVADLDLNSQSTIEIMGEDGVSVGQGRHHFTLPALAVPVTRKNSFMAPEEHLALLENLLREVTAVLIVGWRASETDFSQLCNTNLRGYSEGLRSHVITYGDDEPAADEVIRNFQPHVSLDTGIDRRGFSTVMNDAKDDHLGSLFQ
jgi:hypothetical protein